MYVSSSFAYGVGLYVSSLFINNSSSSTLTVDNVDFNGNSIIKNNTGGTLTISNSTITSNGTPVENLGSFTISDSSLTGTTYSLYDTGSGTSTVTNTILKSNDKDKIINDLKKNLDNK